MEQEPLVNASPKSNVARYVVLAVVLSAVTTGGIVYAIQNKRSNDEKATLQAQVDNLQLRIAAASTATPSPTATATAETSPSPTADATANWKTYSGQGISFKYPSDWTVHAASVGSGTEISLLSSKEYRVEEGSFSPIIITIYQDTSSASIDNYLADSSADYKALLQSETVLVGGKTGYVLRGTTPPVHHDNTLVFAGGKLYTFVNGAKTATESTVDIESITQTFNTLLSTVTFN